jgi:hypothetical protein
MAPPNFRRHGWKRLARNRRTVEMAEGPKTEDDVTGAEITAAIGAFLPLVQALVIQAEGSGKGGAEKHAAVANASEQMYKMLQRSGRIKELRFVPWALIAPFVVPAGENLITLVVTMLNSLFGKVWSFVQGLFDDDESLPEEG